MKLCTHYNSFIICATYIYYFIVKIFFISQIWKMNFLEILKEKKIKNKIQDCENGLLWFFFLQWFKDRDNFSSNYSVIFLGKFLNLAPFLSRSYNYFIKVSSVYSFHVLQKRLREIKFKIVKMDCVWFFFFFYSDSKIEIIFHQMIRWYLLENF